MASDDPVIVSVVNPLVDEALVEEAETVAAVVAEEHAEEAAAEADKEGDRHGSRQEVNGTLRFATRPPLETLDRIADALRASRPALCGPFSYARTAGDRQAVGRPRCR